MPKITDLSGQKYGKLTVISFHAIENKKTKWNCVCECGNKLVVAGGHLKNGHSRSCGCLRKDRKPIDIVGQKYGKLTVISFHAVENKKTKWNCVCECGNKVIINGAALKSGNTSSCGCWNKQRIHEAKFKDLSGLKFGRLMVLEKIGKSYNSFFWLCKCSCGKDVKINGANLVTGGSKSCGCGRLEKTTKHGLSNDLKAYREYMWNKDPSRKLKHYVSNKIRKELHGEKSNKLCFNYLPYTRQELQEHIEKQFESWMNWQNYGKLWHVDHIIPHSKFNYKSMTEQSFRDCWSLSNLRPLEKIENIKKGNKMVS